MHCDVCLFDSAAWTDEDLRGTLDVFAPWWQQLAADRPADLLAPYAGVVAALPRLVVDVDAVHGGWHAIAEAGRALHAAGFGATTDTGQVTQVSVSTGGVPKLPVDRARVTAAGLSGDRQATRKHHGRPWQAVCLWSAEQVDALAAEGHPIGYGSAGENLTLRGLDWPDLRPGTRLQVGGALVEVTVDAVPCRKNGRWFTDGKFGRLKVNSRRYARVLEEGDVLPGDAVVVEPMSVPRQRPAAALASRA